MNVQRHERIIQIKQFSRYLYVCLTVARYVFLLTWVLGLAIIFTANKGNFTIGSASFSEVELTWLQRISFALFVSIIFFLLLKLIGHFRALIQSFAAGDIFNKTAIDHARKALFNGLIIYGLYLCTLLGSWIYTAMQSSPISVSVNGNFIFGLMFFGLMYVLLWALEIGCDLNEESELTI